MAILSRALEVNLADYHVDVAVHPRYSVLRDVMAVYSGMKDEFETFLEELSHPYRNLEFIIKKARRYSLDYFYLFKKHPEGAKGVGVFMGIFLEIVVHGKAMAVRVDAADNMLLYIQKIIRESDDDFPRFSKVLEQAFSQIKDLDDESFNLFVKSYYSLNRLGDVVVHRRGSTHLPVSGLNHLLMKYLDFTYRYFLTLKDPLTWCSENTGIPAESESALEIFRDISSDYLAGLQQKLKDFESRERKNSLAFTEKLVCMPGFQDMIKRYQAVPGKLYQAGLGQGKANRYKLLFLFHITGTEGLGLIHEDALRDINRTMKTVIEEERRSDVQDLIAQTFSILKHWVDTYPETALNSVLSMGEGVFKTDDNDFVNFFIDRVIDLGFQPPVLEAEKSEQQKRTNREHILNIRIWMRIIEMNPKWSSRLIAALVIHLTVRGVSIKDTDLFPRDISRFLGSRIEPVYNLCKQLARLFPSYFNDIGAEGALRDISTEIDELCQRKDRLVHYLRKQSHVESSNLLPVLLESVMDYWRDGEKKHLEKWIPDGLYKEINPEGPYFDGIHDVLESLGEHTGLVISDLFMLPEEQRLPLVEQLGAGTDLDRRRLNLAFQFHKKLCQKYRPDNSDLESYLSSLEAKGFPDIAKLKEILKKSDVKSRLYKLLNYLEKLKALIVSHDSYEAREDIYQKRHITVDIPSMYGSYHETRFDAMGLTFRLEAIVNVLIEEYTQAVDLTLVTKSTFFQIYNRLALFDNILKIDGMYSREYEKQLNLMIFALGSSGFTYTQYLDIIKGFVQAVRNIVNVYFTNIYKLNLDRVLTQTGNKQILPRYRSSEKRDDLEKLKHRISEIFFREKISQALGLQSLDVFLSRILQTLYNQADILPANQLRLLLNYDPNRAMADMDRPETQALGIVVLGNKGLNLCRLTGFGWPVPPGFIITTEVYRSRNILNAYPAAETNFKSQLARHIQVLEKKTNRRLGDPSNPLLLSVRSGSSISQPGMMDSLLNVGMNEIIAERMAETTNNPWFAWDNYRRFLQSYGMSFNLERDDFDRIIHDFKREKGILFKRTLSGAQMKELALKYREFITVSGVHIEDDPFEQLRICIGNVFESWELPKARMYRKIMGISDDWGTAVTVQSMVFGNISSNAGSGVLFTHNPKLPGDTLKLWGDFTIGNQGEDVAAGLVNTLPISDSQKELEQRNTNISLETHFPEIFLALKTFTTELIRTRNWSPQEIEFTFESPRAKDLHILQARDMVFDTDRTHPVFDVEDALFQGSYIAHGIGVSGGAMSGRIVFSVSEIEMWRNVEPETALILVRSDTVPDDIKEIHAADGLLTARGGITSHASVVAHRLEKTCVVGCSELYCDEKNKLCRFGEKTFHSGEFLSINGQEGSVYHGYFRVKDT